MYIIYIYIIHQKPTCSSSLSPYVQSTGHCLGGCDGKGARRSTRENGATGVDPVLTLQLVSDHWTILDIPAYSWISAQNVAEIYQERQNDEIEVADLDCPGKLAFSFCVRFTKSRGSWLHWTKGQCMSRVQR